MAGWSVEWKNLNKILAKLDADLYHVPITNFFERIAEAGLNKGRERAPVRRGTLRASMGRGGSDSIFEIDKAPLPKFARIGSHVSNRGFNYPKFLDESDRTHYRGGGAQGKAASGQPTKNWFTGVKSLLGSTIKSAAKLAEKEIRQRWDR